MTKNQKFLEQLNRQNPEKMGNFESKREGFMHIGKEIRNALEKARMSHQELGEEIGVSRHNVSYTTQQPDTYCHRVAKISQITGVDILQKLRENYDLNANNTNKPGEQQGFSKSGKETEVERLRREKKEILDFVENHTDTISLLLKQYRD